MTSTRPQLLELLLRGGELEDDRRCPDAGMVGRRAGTGSNRRFPACLRCRSYRPVELAAMARVLRAASPPLRALITAPGGYLRNRW